MFSGIVQCVGEVVGLEAISGGGKRFLLRAPLPISRLGVGDSVAHSGACMTIESAQALGPQTSEYRIGVSPESLSKTTLDGWQVGTRVNLETSLKAGDPNGGHNVMGHVDGVAELTSMIPRGTSWDLRFAVAADFMAFLPHKGSVALDGMSLTIVDPDREANSFGVAVIPHTWAVTTLPARKVGDRLNFEIDTFARYIAHYVDHFMAAKGTNR